MNILKVVFCFCTLLLINQSFALDYCGDNDAESPDYNWSEISRVSITSPYADIDGIFCGGIAREDETRLRKIVYRDANGTSRIYDVEYLMGGRRILLRGEDLGGIAQVAIKEGPLFSLMVDEENVRQGNTQYRILMRFVRNLRKGIFSNSKDVREVEFFAVKSHQDDTITTSYFRSGRDEFNNFVLNISFGLYLDTIYLKDFSKPIRTILTTNLPAKDDL